MRNGRSLQSSERCAAIAALSGINTPRLPPYCAAGAIRALAPAIGLPEATRYAFAARGARFFSLRFPAQDSCFVRSIMR